MQWPQPRGRRCPVGGGHATVAKKTGSALPALPAQSLVLGDDGHEK